MRYRLIRALIETLKDLQKFKNVKFIIALRQDLLYRVFRETRDSGFQEEKYEPLILRLKWIKTELLEIFDKRLNELVRRQYTKTPVSWTDLFPKKVGKIDTATYLIERTMYRPRDLIQFGNCCIELAANKPNLTVTLIRNAEGTYSTRRFRSLGDEWIVDYPNLLICAEILKRRDPTFTVLDLPEKEIEQICLNAFDSTKYEKTGKVCKWANEVLKSSMDISLFRLRLIKMFYETGLIGIKIEKNQRISWSFLDDNVIREAEINEYSRAEICPIFYRVLGTNLRSE